MIEDEVIKKVSKQYFTEDTENAIVEYLACEDEIQRNRIYNERINYAFNKLVENIIHTFKFYYSDVDTMSELKHEVITFLLSKLHKYSKDKGKAFSYFGTIAKRWLIVYNETNYKKRQDRGELGEVDTDDTINNDLSNQYSSPIDLLEFMEMYISNIELNMNEYFPKPVDNKIACAVLVLFKKRENIQIFNKKAIYIFIKEMVDADTFQITRVIKKYESIYNQLLSEYYNLGEI